MNVLRTLSPLTLAFLASVFTTVLGAVGAAMIFFCDKSDEKFSVIAEGFAAGIMLAASYFSLLAPAFEYPCAVPHAVAVGSGFFLGGVFVLSFGKLFEKKRLGGDGLLYAAVTLHNIPEGLAVGMAFAGGGFLPALLLTIGIGVQNFPEGLCVACPIRARGASRRKSFWLATLSGAAEIPAALLGVIAVRTIGALMPWALAFAAGAMIAVTTIELLPSAAEKNKRLTLFLLLDAFTLMMALDTAL
jgi:ZIP family zinc transporter